MSQELTSSTRSLLAKNIFKYRKAKNITREKLSLLIGMDNSYISKLEKCRMNVTIDIIDLIAKQLEIKVTQLFEE